MMQSQFDLPVSPALYTFHYAYAAERGLPALTSREVGLYAPLDGVALQKAFALIEAARVRLSTGDILACPLSLRHQATGRPIPVTPQQLRDMLPRGSAD